MALILALCIVALAYQRFRNVPLDRDWTPYAYPALHGTGYLENGHQDIKPPLIHWGFKAWMRIATRLRFNQTSTLRLLPGLALMLSVTLLYTVHPSASIVLALLLTAPSLWAHMANTEWMTVLLLAAITSTAMAYPAISWLILGLLPWVNQKNVLLIPIVAWTCLKMPSWQMVGCMAAPSALIMAYLTLTGRFRTLIRWTWTIPAQFGKARTLRANTLGHLHLLKPGLFLMLPFIATMQGPWVWVLLAMVALALWSKQIVPHHLLLLAFPIALASQPTWTSWAAFGIAWVLIEFPAWMIPANVYALTFADKSGAHYGMSLDEGKWAADWLKDNAPNEDTIWVNGMENNIYLQSGRKAWAIIVPELRETPKGKAPNVIIHCRGAVPFDYDAEGFENVEMSPLGGIAIMRRTNAS